MTEPETIKQNRKPNKLINEKSPYLLQRAYNPVNWKLDPLQTVETLGFKKI
ncbi:thioredoxin domain-containing protein [Clostridium estertheticum]|uniref:Thioredoxin domain-containing protein n=1 Tax=Clostridium estertheticum TaxID=238834 RepID=A0AA47I7V2_9CLOT|nr:thioredoxin domain-containing protein [Clostridium estertheticum]WAG60804.1 thioredoxin domain-containing protein [Clostridium estertheticum]